MSDNHAESQEDFARLQERADAEGWEGPRCKWYVSIMQPECGDPAPHEVKVKTRVAQATIQLCDKHKAIHDERAASIRTARKSKS